MTKGTLFIIGTPIGNLEDLTKRAERILKEVPHVACEDTRVTSSLLASIGVKPTLHALHQHSSDHDIKKVITLLETESVAFVSDAGMPGISDPGGKLVAEAARHEIQIIPIPGVSAVTTLLSVSGFPTDEFVFLGFPPHKKGRNSFFEHLASIESAVVLFESKHRIEKTLAQLPQDRFMVVGRELTKMHETLYRGTASEILAQCVTTSTKGEFTIALAPKNWN